MSRGHRIALLFHARARDAHIRRSLVVQLAPYWRESGHEVIVLRGTRRHVPADLLFVHVDLSVVPEKYLAFAARYPIAVNGGARDIRKSQTSGGLLRPGDGWCGPVIAKSDLNAAGRPERSAGSRGWLQSRPSPFRSWRDYTIFDTRDQVPPELQTDRRVVLERFIPEIEDGLYRLRMYQFLGDRWNCTRMASPDPLVKADNSVLVERVSPHPQVEDWRRELKLDYGKLDYVVHKGEPVLIDANKTTGTGLAVTEAMHTRRRHRAAGIEWFFRAPEARAPIDLASFAASAG